jgi:hypothetical protein
MPNKNYPCNTWINPCEGCQYHENPDNFWLGYDPCTGCEVPNDYYDDQEENDNA